jgi:hypothetical protein
VRALAVSVAIAALVGGCGLLPEPQAAAPSLSTSFDADGVTFTLDPWRKPFAASRSPWFLAVTGQNGTSSNAFVMLIENSPIPSDPGPS